MRYYDYTVKPYLHKLFKQYDFQGDVSLRDLDTTEQNQLLFYAIKLREIGFTELDCAKVEQNVEIYLLSGEKKDKEIMADSLLDAYKECFNDYIQTMIDEEFELYKDKQDVERKLEAGLTPHQDSETGELVWR